MTRRTMRGTPKSSRREGSTAGRTAWDAAGWLRDHGDDAGALLLGAFASVTVLGMLGLTQGSVVNAWVNALRQWLGWFAFIVPLTMALGAVALGRRRLGVPWQIPWPKIVALEIALFAGMGALELAADIGLAESEAGRGGGLIGWGVGALMSGVLGRWGGFAALAAITVGASIVALGGAPSLVDVTQRPRVSRDEDEWLPEPAPLEALAAESPPKEAEQGEAAPAKAQARKPAQTPRRTSRWSRDKRLPAFDLLDRTETRRATSKEISQMAAVIERTLGDFGIPAKVVDHRTGPSVTQFAVEPGFIEQTGADGAVKRQKVRVSQISSLSDDLALALSAPTVRVEAPVPGHAYVGIEVPHRRPALVSLRAVMESEAFQRINSPLAIALGRDVAGDPVAADLVGMPHLLVAGTTGSGKSVLMTSIAACLLLNNTPADLQLVLIDPKMVEMVRFNGVPHLVGRVETDLNRIVVVLRWCTQEMDRRYRDLEKEGARDLDAYNRRVGRRRDGRTLPRLVIMIDELADLMMMAPDQTERTLVRLAQMGRATGIHLVVATQRPSTDIVTGLIKANFPARISFAVPSMIDSRVILDGPGAETLLGKGDMLFLSPEASAPIRLQGVFIGDAEVRRLIGYWDEAAEAVVATDETADEEAAPWEDLMSRVDEPDASDEVLEKAIALVRKTGQASASMLQRRLRIGYPRAARLMDELEELGIVGRSQTGGKTREVLLRDEDDEDDTYDEDDS